jgi:hypothetical protein
LKSRTGGSGADVGVCPTVWHASMVWLEGVWFGQGIGLDRGLVGRGLVWKGFGLYRGLVCTGVWFGQGIGLYRGLVGQGFGLEGVWFVQGFGLYRVWFGQGFGWTGVWLEGVWFGQGFGLDRGLVGRGLVGRGLVGRGLVWIGVWFGQVWFRKFSVRRGGGRFLRGLCRSGGRCGPSPGGGRRRCSRLSICAR